MTVPPSYRLDVRACVPAKSVKRPMPVLQGRRDYQATEADLRIRRDALRGRSGLPFRPQPDRNRLSMAGTGEAAPSEHDKRGTVAWKALTGTSNWIGGADGPFGARSPDRGGSEGCTRLLRSN